MASENVKQVFKNTLKKVSSGKQVNISQEMRDVGYSESSARCQKVVRTDTWQQLLDLVDDEEIISKFKEILRADDKRASMDAGKELLKLKDRYPKQSAKIIGLYEKVESLRD